MHDHPITNEPRSALCVLNIPQNALYTRDENTKKKHVTPFCVACFSKNTRPLTHSVDVRVYFQISTNANIHNAYRDSTPLIFNETCPTVQELMLGYRQTYMVS